MASVRRDTPIGKGAGGGGGGGGGAMDNISDYHSVLRAG